MVWALIMHLTLEQPDSLYVTEIFRSQILKKANLDDPFEEKMEKKPYRLEKLTIDVELSKKLDTDIVDAFDRKVKIGEVISFSMLIWMILILSNLNRRTLQSSM